MNCVKCNGVTRVYETRNGGEVIYRHRRCTLCKHTFLTHEKPVEGNYIPSTARIPVRMPTIQLSFGF